MSRENAPVAFARSGDTVRFETLDCFGCQIHAEDQILRDIDWSNINPATDPLYIDGALPGDVLKVEILNIQLDDHGRKHPEPGFLCQGTRLEAGNGCNRIQVVCGSCDSQALP